MQWENTYIFLYFAVSLLTFNRKFTRLGKPTISYTHPHYLFYRSIEKSVIDCRFIASFTEVGAFPECIPTLCNYGLRYDSEAEDERGDLPAFFFVSCCVSAKGNEMCGLLVAVRRPPK